MKYAGAGIFVQTCMETQLVVQVAVRTRVIAVAGLCDTRLHYTRSHYIAMVNIFFTDFILTAA